MHNTNRLSALVVVVGCSLSVAAGCKDEERRAPNAAAPATSPAGGGTRPAAGTTAPAPDVAALDVHALLRAGGANWSSVPEGEPAGPGVPAAGSDYWIWPAEDVAYVPERGANATLAVRLNWRLRPGGKPAGDKLYGVIASAARPGAPPFTLRNIAEGFDGQAAGGVVEIRFAPWKAAAAGDVVLFASKPGSASAVSNLLRLKVTPPPPLEEKGERPPGG